MELRQQQPEWSEETLQALCSEHGEALLAYATRLARERLMTEGLFQETQQTTSRPADVLSEERGLEGQMVTFQRRGRLWKVELGNRTALVPHSLGMSYLAALLANPEYEIAALELAAGNGLSSTLPGECSASSSQAVLDEKAKRDYREQLAALEAEVDEHESNHDLARAERARAERDWLVAQLAAAIGLGGRVRNFTGNEERARISVGKAIRRAINRIAAAEPAIGETLWTSIHTGLRCSYRPY